MFDVETPYIKASQKKTPTKATHKHEYIRPFTMMKIRRFDSTISDVKYKFTLTDRCMDCGHISRKRRDYATEIELTPKQWKIMHEMEEKS